MFLKGNLFQYTVLEGSDEHAPAPNGSAQLENAPDQNGF